MHVHMRDITIYFVNYILYKIMYTNKLLLYVIIIYDELGQE